MILTCSDYPKNVYRWHPAISEWMYMVESKQFPACEEQFLLMDLMRYKLAKDNVFVDHEKLDNAINTAEKYFFELYPFQKFIYAAVFGMYQYDEDGDIQLVFNEHFIYAGRGFGKNAIMSPIAFELTTANHGIEEYRVDIVATSEEQAKTSFKDVHNMLEKNKKLMKPKYKWNEKIIEHKKNKSSIKYRTSAPKTKDGGRPGCVAFDEIHAYEDFKSFNVHTTGLGKIKFARRFYLTTDGEIRGSVLDNIKEKALTVLKNCGKNVRGKESRIFPFMCRLDSDEEVKDPKMWVKANPTIAYRKELRLEVEGEYEDALDIPSLMLTFMTKRMNRPKENVFVMVANWEAIEAGKKHEMIDIRGMQCIGAVDFSSTLDFTAVGLLFKKGNMRYFLHHSFITEYSKNYTEYNFPMDDAIEDGLCTIVYDEIIKEEDIAEWFLEQVRKYNIKILHILGDRYRIKTLEDEFTKKGLPLKEVPSGPITHGKLAPLIDKLFARRWIAYPNDYMMSWYTNNVKVIEDLKGNRTYEKIDPEKRKTDGFMALVHALTHESEIKPAVKINRKLRTYNY